MIDENLIAYLKAQGVTRAHTGNAPQATEFPVAVVRRSSGNTPRTLGGTKLFSRATFSIDVVALNYADAMSLSTTIRDALDGYTGTFASTPAGTDTRIQSCRCVNEPVDGSEIDGDRVLRRITQDFLFVYLES